MQEDITAQRQSDEKIEWLARHDTLTEIPNRFHFRERLEHQFGTYDPRQGFALCGSTSTTSRKSTIALVTSSAMAC